ncbi:MAG: sugar-binding protein, partial [Bacteroidota bacterium]
TDDTWYDPNGVLAGKITIGYDNSGNQIEYSQLEKDGSYLLNYLYKYKFDNMGNWIERISSNKGQPYEFCTRKIEYY